MHEINAIQTLKRTKGKCYCKKKKKKKKETKLGKKGQNHENTQQVSNCRNDQQIYGLSKTGKYLMQSFPLCLKKTHSANNQPVTTLENIRR